VLAPLGEVRAATRHEAELTDEAGLRALVREVRPRAIVNAAAYTAVDRAESEPALAQAVNAEAPRVLAEEAAALGALLVHYSTDYVFDGLKSAPYVESDPTGPLGVYGASKLAGEQAIAASGCRHLVFRTSWVYCARGRNFLLTMRKLLAERDEVRVVNDQRGAPTWARAIAQATAAVLSKVGPGFDLEPDADGVYHMTAAGETTWYGFARAILAAMPGSPAVRLTPIATVEYPTPARRPANSVLSNERLTREFGVRLPAWEQGLADCLRGVESGAPG